MRASGPYRPRGSQRAEFARGNSGPDVVLKGVTLGKETEKAILVSRDGEADLWMPLSQVKSMVRTKHKGEDEITVSAWIAEQKGLK